MTTPTPHEVVTQLLADWSRGDRTALDRLMQLVCGELRRLARHYLGRERAGHTLHTTALVNGACLRHVGRRGAHRQNRAHFFAVSAQVMRHILVAHTRGQARAKRGGALARTSLNEAAQMSPERAGEPLAPDEAPHALEEVDARRSRVVELRHFGCLRNEEIAEVSGVTPVTAGRDWRWTKARLYRELAAGGDDDGREL